MALDWLISFQHTSRKRPHSKSLQRYDAYKKARTMKEFYDLGGTCKDINHDYKNGLCILKHPQTGAVYAYSGLSGSEVERFRFQDQRPLVDQQEEAPEVAQLKAEVAGLKAEVARLKAEVAQLKFKQLPDESGRNHGGNVAN